MFRFSIVVPVFGQPELLANCLRSIRKSSFTDYELLVSDDGTPDAAPIAALAEEYGARLITAPQRSGSAAARNRAAQAASAEILVFIDSDVTLHDDTLAQFAEAFKRYPSLDAVFGSYDLEPGKPAVVSRFRNLLHAYVHQHANADASTFWTGCGAVRRKRFLELGGFKEAFSQPSIEDVEFGLRLHEAGGRIRLEPRIQVTHHKTWTMRSMIRTDLMSRAIPWAELIHEHGLPRDLNFKLRERFAAGLTALLVPLLIVAVQHRPYWALVLADLLALAFLHAPLLGFFKRCGGLAFAAACFPLLLIYNLTCVVGLVLGLSRGAVLRDRWLGAALLASAALILTFQIVDGAYRAEFDAEADEAAHFVSALMVYDYLNALPRENPVVWAERFYVHYPKVALGHWPPGYYVMEAAWWMMIPPGRASAMLLNAVMMLIIAAVFYGLLRRIVPPWLALTAVLVLIAAPAVQRGYTENMADLPCLLWATLLLDAFARYLRRPAPGSLALIGLWLTCGLVTKGTAVCLVPIPLIALLLAGGWRFLRQPLVLLSAAALFFLGFGWYLLERIFFHEDMRTLAGASAATQVPWDAPVFLPRLTGYGILALALVGMLVAIYRRWPEAVASAVVFGSTAAVSWRLRAMAEERHFIIVIPALILLATAVVGWMGQRFRPAMLAGLPALVLFPFGLCAQHSSGFARLLQQIHRPSRMMISSSPEGEGGWIAETALTEKPFTSLVARATKTLASTNWNGDRYRLLTKTAADVAARMDALDVDVIVVHWEPDEKIPPHQLVLDDMLAQNDAWKRCASVGDHLVAYCRTRPPTGAREPLRIDLTNKIGQYVEE